jgi:site-specific DNA recombinase
LPVVREIRRDRVAIYIRWSTEEQTEGTTLETQKERCMLYVRSQGWQVNEALLFIDEGCSGGSLDRPAIARLREAVRRREIDCVVTYSLDRLSRSVADTVQLVQHEWLGKAIYRSASQPISTEDGNPTGQLIFNILASFAEFERALIRERTHSGLVRRAKQGKYPGTRVAPFGYKRDGKGHLVIDSGAADGTVQGPAAVVRRMFQMAVSGSSGQGPTLIARALAAEGIPAPGGQTWWAHQVRTILRNPVYCGDLVYGRRRVNPAHRRDKSAPQRLYNQKPLAVVGGATPAIVDRETWTKAQQLFAGRAVVSARKNLQAKNRSLLAGIARCKCGGPLSVFYDRCKRRYYRCSRNFLSAGGCPFRPGVLQAELTEAAVVAAVKERYGTPSLRASAQAEAAAARSSGERMQGFARAIAEAERLLQAVDEDLARLRRSARRGEIKLSTFEELKADAEAERAQLLQRGAELEAQLSRARSPQSLAADWAAAMARLDLWEALDPVSRREILHGLFRNVLIFKPKGSHCAPEINLVWEMA